MSCILKWFEEHDECPTCRTEQDTDEIILFKKNVEDTLRIKYQDAIRSLQTEVAMLRMRRPR
jgi:hypothetical protein